jgi:guanosine-3',5'-bis(diphosphate) 3'-pyrophosphohydrolase
MTGITRLEQRDLVDLLHSLGVCSDRVPDALVLAESVHGEQRRDGGGPYLEEHIYPVTAEVAHYLSCADPAAAADAVLTAILHDTIEDSSTVTEQAIGERFGDTVASAVATLSKPTKRGGKSSDASAAVEERYVARIAGSALPVRAIKVFDRINNLAALQQRPPAKQRPYLAETHAYYLDLARSVDESLVRQMADLLTKQEACFKDRAAT